MFFERYFGMEPWFFADCFFTYSFLGYIFECILLTIQKQRPISHRGFVHGPFCIIYGIGAFFIRYALVPVSRNYAVLFLVGAVSITLFELAAGMAMRALFGEVWWDYGSRPFNYKGIICLESSIGWGVLSVYTAAHLHKAVVDFTGHYYSVCGKTVALLLITWYTVDLAVSLYSQKTKKPDKAK